jgi:hypothetical protein
MIMEAAGFGLGPWWLVRGFGWFLAWAGMGGGCAFGSALAWFVVWLGWDWFAWQWLAGLISFGLVCNWVWVGSLVVVSSVLLVSGLGWRRSWLCVWLGMCLGLVLVSAWLGLVCLAMACWAGRALDWFVLGLGCFHEIHITR